MMKKVVSIMVLCCLVFAIVGCSGKSAVQQAIDTAIDAYKNQLPPERVKKLPMSMRKKMVKNTMNLFKKGLKRQGHSVSDADMKYMEKRIKELMLVK